MPRIFFICYLLDFLFPLTPALSPKGEEIEERRIPLTLTLFPRRLPRPDFQSGLAMTFSSKGEDNSHKGIAFRMSDMLY